MFDNSREFVVISDGAWGTALALVLCNNANNVVLWSYDPVYAEEMQRTRRNPKYLDCCKLPDNLFVTADPARALRQAELLVAVAPTKFARAAYTGFAPHYKDTPVVCASKGIEAESRKTGSQLIEEILGTSKIAILAGPSHAEEVVNRKPATVVVAGNDSEFIEDVQILFSTDYFRVYTNPDPVGVEMCGPVKNVIAIAAGICDGLELGDNAKSALLTRGMMEMRRMLEGCNANPNTASGLAGIGDLITTSISPFGRNRHVGYLLAKGKTLPQIIESMNAVAEGITTTRALLEIAGSLNVELPICEMVSRVLFEGKPPLVGVTELMTRTLKSEM